MSNAVLSHSVDAKPPRAVVLALVLVLWLAAVLVLAARGAFVSPPGTPPLPIFLGVALPLGAFLAALAASPALRRLALAVDLPLVTAIQAWRFAGFGFLALWAHGVLPGLFAWPAAVGDVAVALAAPWLAAALVRRPRLAAGRGFAAFQLFGIADLVVAVGTGTLASLLAAPGEPSTGPMATLPLVLIPAYFVPLFLMLHVVALMQARRARRR